MTTRLMIYSGPVEPDAVTTRTGGLPLLPAEVEWPRCTCCGGTMQFLARIEQDGTVVDEAGAPTGDRRVAQVFMCDNDPGGCSTWEPLSGANAVVVLPPGPAPARPAPEEGRALLPVVGGVRFEESDAQPDPEDEFSDPYDTARMEWLGHPEKRVRDILGQLGGTASWVQWEQSLFCPECREPLRFLAQLEEGHDFRTRANYGGGSAYVYLCPTHDLGAFFWQQ
ncbi:hypothetical protein AB0I60_05745 [Actinosynnema sp. NPDC050436]|uniref:hypothetical protein n=1 Tax=Actinosynnema sp. NPDC050436 TaxID=3155659 RepID=UPI0033F50231